MAEESKLVEEVISSGEENKQESFDPTSFLGSETQASEALSEQPVDNQETAETTETVEKELDMDDFTWDSIEDEQKEVEVVAEEKVEEVKEEDDDWDSDEVVEAVKEEAPKVEEFDWNSLSEETGIQAESKEEFVAKVQEALKPQVDDNDTIKNLNNFLELTDKDLVIADMKASKYEDEAIDDTIDRLEDSGLLKREATLIRQQLSKHIHSEKDRIRTEKANEEKQQAEASVKSRKDLQNFIKGKDEFFGGKVSQKDKKQLYSYITKGNFAQDVFESHANVAEAAFLWQNKDKIFKMIKTQGVEQGKSRVLDNITSPSRNNRSSNSFEAPSKGFDPKKFLG
jgi:hypothetical protein